MWHEERKRRTECMTATSKPRECCGVSASRNGHPTNVTVSALAGKAERLSLTGLRIIRRRLQNGFLNQTHLLQSPERLTPRRSHTRHTRRQNACPGCVFCRLYHETSRRRRTNLNRGYTLGRWKGDSSSGGWFSTRMKGEGCTVTERGSQQRMD